MKKILSAVCMLLCALMLLSLVPSAAIAEDANATRYLEINTTNFPDKKFRSWIINNLDHKGTKSGGYYMTKTQVENVTQIYCSNWNIANLKGIEHFINLNSLDCSGNGLTALDVSKNVNLMYLECGYYYNNEGNYHFNQLKSLDLTKNTKLEYLDASNNELTGLDLSKNTKLWSLWIPNNQLTSLNLSGCTKLYSLSCAQNNLTSLKLGSKPELDQVYCGGNSLTSLDLSKAPALTYLYCSENKLSSLDLSNNTKLEYLYCSNNRLTKLDVSKNLKLIQIACSYNRISSMDVSKNTKLDSFSAYGQQLTAKNGTKYNGKYQFDMKLLVPMELMSRVSMSGNLSFNKKTGIVTFNEKTDSLSYTMDPQALNGQTMDVTFDLSYVTQKTPAITTQPTNQVAAIGKKTTFTIKATGGTLAYQWYYQAPDTTTWNAISAASAKSSAYTLTVKEKHNGYKYKCVVKNLAGKVTSSVVTLKAGYAPEVTTQPASKTVIIGNTASFKVVASGAGLKYQWYYKSPSMKSWKASSASCANTSTYKVTVAEKHDGYQYRCKISNTYGYVYSNAATLSVTDGTTHYRALLIGEEDFNPICTRNRGDVLHMKSMLGTVKGPKGSKYTVTAKYNLGYSGVKTAIKNAFSGSSVDDVCLFFIATHGNSYGDGELALTDGNSLDFATLASWLSTYAKGDVIVFIESCGAGSAIYKNGNADFDAEKFTQLAIEAFAAEDQRCVENKGVGAMRKSKYYVLAAAAHHEESWGYEGETPAESGNMFTDWLIEGIGKSGHMPADTNNNNTVSLKELYTYIKQYDDYQHVQVYPTTGTYYLFKR